MTIWSSRLAVWSHDHHVTFLFLKLRTLSTQSAHFHVSGKCLTNLELVNQSNIGTGIGVSRCISTSKCLNSPLIVKKFSRLNRVRLKQQQQHHSSCKHSSLHAGHHGHTWNRQCFKLEFNMTKHSVWYAPQSKSFCTRSSFVEHKIPHGFRLQPPWRLLFFGTDDFAVTTLKALNENR